MIYANPNTEGSLVQFKESYENYIGGEWVPPVKGQYLEVKSPVTGKVFTLVARSSEEDIEIALDAAHAAKEGNPLYPVPKLMDKYELMQFYYDVME